MLGLHRTCWRGRKEEIIDLKKGKKKKKETHAELLIFNRLSGRLNMSSTPRVQTTPFKVNFGSFYKLSNKTTLPTATLQPEAGWLSLFEHRCCGLVSCWATGPRLFFFFFFVSFHLFPVFIFRLTSHFIFIACIKVALIFSVQINAIFFNLLTSFLLHYKASRSLYFINPHESNSVKLLS